MLMKRLAGHLRQQDWVAFAVEFVIVVAGVFIGIEVSNWNDVRAERAEERAILSQMHDELEDALVDRASFTQRARERGEHLYALRPRFYGLEPFGTLTAEECDAIGLSHVRELPVLGIPVLQELASTGRVRVLRDDDLRREASTLLRQLDSMEARIAPTIAEVYDLPGEFPQAIQAGLAVADDPRDFDGYMPISTCNGEALRRDQRFLNAFSTNVRSYNAYLLVGFVQVDQQLENLHAALDAELGLSHEGEAQALPTD